MDFCDSLYTFNNNKKISKRTITWENNVIQFESFLSTYIFQGTLLFLFIIRNFKESVDA